MRKHLVPALIMLPLTSLSSLAVSHPEDSGLVTEHTKKNTIEGKSASNAESSEESEQLFIKGLKCIKESPANTEDAFIFFKKAAELGHIIAQNNLGTMHLKNKNDKEALKCFQTAAINGNPDAQLNLGSMYYKGLGIEKNDDQALDWFEKSAEKGNRIAQYNAGMIYYHKFSKDSFSTIHYNKAKTYLEQAADQGDESAKSRLDSLLKLKTMLLQNSN